MRLTPTQLSVAERTISSNAFHHIVMHHAKVGKSLSVVRMGDAEVLFLDEAKSRRPDEVVDLFDESWNDRMGVKGLTYGELKHRLTLAATECTYFAPSVNGIVHEKFDLTKHFKRDKYVDNFFVNQWSHEQKHNLFEACHNITFIHRNTDLADEYQKRLTRFRVDYIHLSSWDQTEKVLEQEGKLRNQLVLFSGGCGAKFIGPRMAKAGKLVIDVGNAAEFWLPPC